MFCVSGFSRRMEIMLNTKLYVMLFPITYKAKYQDDEVKMGRTYGTCG